MMLKRLFFLFFLILFSAAAASWLSQQPGTMTVEWLGWTLQLPTSLAVGLMVLFALMLVFFDRILRAIRTMPGWFGGRLRERRFTAGHRALTLGLMAVSAGEPEAARKQANRAARLLDSPQLTGLLAAQAAHLAGDHQAARRYFTSILADRETAFLGHIGLMRLALDDGDAGTARSAARAALDLNPKSDLAAQALVKLETDRAAWQAALPALAVLQKQRRANTNPADRATIRRQETAIHYLAARDHQNEDLRAKRLGLEKALKSDPGFLPALCALADLYLDQTSHGKAAKILQDGFVRTPHPDLLGRLRAAWKANDGQFVSRLEKLVQKVVSSRRSAAYELVADAAKAAGLDGEAARLLHLASDEHAHADTVLQPASWQCVSCKSLLDAWHSHCPSCGAFASLAWQVPEKVTPLIAPKT